jgi:hypothetical protein
MLQKHNRLLLGTFPVYAENLPCILQRNPLFVRFCAENFPCMLHRMTNTSAVKILVFPSSEIQ